MRAVHQGAARYRDARADDRARAHLRAGLGGRATRPADLSSAAPLGVILAGGSSRRLGGIPKGLETIGGRRIIDRVADALRPATSDLVLAANDPQAKDWLPGVVVVHDAFQGSGGLAGVHAALELGRDTVVVAWDMPFVTPELVARLVQRSEGCAAVVPEGVSPHEAEPFCAYYSVSLREELERFLESGGGAARTFLSRIRTARRLRAADVSALGDPRRLFFSVNTPEDLERARAMAETAQ